MKIMDLYRSEMKFNVNGISKEYTGKLSTDFSHVYNEYGKEVKMIVEKYFLDIRNDFQYRMVQHYQLHRIAKGYYIKDYYEKTKSKLFDDGAEAISKLAANQINFNK